MSNEHILAIENRIVVLREFRRTNVANENPKRVADFQEQIDVLKRALEDEKHLYDSQPPSQRKNDAEQEVMDSIENEHSDE